ncbi:MAG: hypothetical protein WC628_04310 [Candidatus Omnitrophota bacterium]
MKKRVVVLGVLLLVFWVTAFADEFAWQEIGRGNLDLYTVLASPDNLEIIYFGTNKGLFKSGDGGATWQNILLLRGQNKKLNFILRDPLQQGALYAATGSGLYFIPAQASPRKIFQGKNTYEAQCSSLAVSGGVIFLGTKAGLFISEDNGNSWHKASAKLGNSSILAIACSVREPKLYYAACVDGVYRSTNFGVSWERIFVSHTVENNSGEDDDSDAQGGAEGRSSRIRHIVIDPANPENLFLATSRGIYQSKDKGDSWSLLPDEGLLSCDVSFLLLSEKSELYAASKSAVFVYKDSRWYELSFVLAAGRVRGLALAGNQLYAACEKGLFKAAIADLKLNHKPNLFREYVQNEPDIKQVQQAAIKYAEVQPEKIKKWRSAAAKKAILPQVSVGLDRNVNDLWHWESGSTTKLDDDVLRRGRDALGWDVRLSWDLGDLIWNDAQTSIDVRSRLMVELRDEILDEVIKIYFERIRVKIELEDLALEDKKKRFEKGLRFQELTASLDALTGGYFSRALANKPG